MIKNKISLFLATFLIIGFFFLALPEKVLSQPFCPGNGEVINGSLDSENGPFQFSRIFRDAVSSNCNPPKAFPGTFGNAQQNYNIHEFSIANGDSCVTVNYTSGNCETSALPVAYMNSYDPTNLSLNYLGDTGTNAAGLASFDFEIPSGNQLLIVVTSVDGPVDCDYSFTVENYSCQPPIITTPIPTLSEWGLIIMTGVLGIVGFLVIRRRKVTA